jgi:hypothetical protein
LQEVSLPPTLESIGEGAFKGCERLPEIAIPDKVKYRQLGFPELRQLEAF